jgi:hypothetical protein
LWSATTKMIWESALGMTAEKARPAAAEGAAIPHFLAGGRAASRAPPWDRSGIRPRDGFAVRFALLDELHLA